MELKIDSIDFSYDETLVLEDVSFELKAGEILSIIGPNGSGKSTLIKCINRILDPQQGSLIFNGRDLLNLTREDLARHLGYVPQNESRNFPVTVFDAIMMGRKPYISWKPREKDMEIVSEIIEKLQLEDLCLRDVKKLSGGQRQKVLFGRALAQEPDILLLDEPTSDLDLRHQLEVLELIRQETGRGIAAVTAIHDLSLASRYSDKFLMLSEGRVYAAGGREVLSPENLQEVYGVEVAVLEHRGEKIIVPESPIA